MKYKILSEYKETRNPELKSKARTEFKKLNRKFMCRMAGIREHISYQLKDMLPHDWEEVKKYTSDNFFSRIGSRLYLIFESFRLSRVNYEMGDIYWRFRDLYTIFEKFSMWNYTNKFTYETISEFFDFKQLIEFAYLPVIDEIDTYANNLFLEYEELFGEDYICTLGDFGDYPVPEKME